MDRRRCSLVSRQNGEDPVGSALGLDHYLVIEVALPWASEIEESRRITSPLRGLLRRLGYGLTPITFLAVAPDPVYSLPGLTRVVFFRRPDRPFARFDRSEYLVPEDQTTGLVEALCFAPQRLDRFAAFRADDAPTRDLLVCTHGTQDACCATFGYPIYSALRRHHAADETCLRVWRASHFGGHRFAPTLIDFPQGHYWGPVDGCALPAIVDRSGPLEALSSRYRGWAGLGFHEQVAEREILLREGWRWIEFDKQGQVIDGPTDLDYDEAVFGNDPPRSVTVRIDYAAPDGSLSGAYEATVERSHRLTSKGECFLDELHDVWQYRVTRLERVSRTWTA